MELKDNHIIIGLGGTGGNILKAFRKRIFSEFSFEERRKLPIGFVYMDSSDSMMKPDDQTWKILGENAQLGKNSQVYIGDANLRDQLNNLSRYPGISGWIGDKIIWGKIAPHIVQGAAAAQRRRVGRFLFANNATKFLDAVKNQIEIVSKITQQSPVTFHILTGLAGGTGSGTIIDVIAQLRKTYSSKTTEKIFVYTFLPEKEPKPGWDKGYYHANGYAALLELNALSVEAFKPHDVTGQSDRVENECFFNGCYLFSNENENNIKVDIFDQLPSILSNFLFQKLTLTPGGVAKREFDTNENFENNVDEKYELEGLEKLRSRMFLSFGIKRIEIPEEEIIEFFTYNFLNQALLQFKYNHWTEFGYSDSFQDFNYVSYVKDKNTLNNWYLSDDHISLSLPILESDKNQNWRTIREDWNSIIPTLKSVAWENPTDKTTPINQLSKFCEERFDKNFRKVGVTEFYQNNRKAKTDIAKVIVSEIEKILFNDWRVGYFSFGTGKIPCSIYHVGKTLEALISETEIRLGTFSNNLVQIADEIEKLILDKQKNEVMWSKAGTLKVLLGKHKRIFEAHGVILQSLYTKKTESEAYKFAKELLAEILNKLQVLRGEVDQFSSKISKMIEDSEKKIASRCQDHQLNQDSFKEAIIRYYDVSKVKDFIKNVVANEEIQRNQSSVLRNKIIEPINTEPTFTKFNERISDGFLTDTFEKTCKERAINEHNNVITSKKNRIIGVSIIDKLYEQFNLDYDRLKDFLRPLAEYSGTFVHFDDGEIQASKEQIGKKIKCGRTLIILPKSDDKKDFVDKLKQAFNDVFNESLIFDDESDKQNEICVMKITYCFPLRGVKEVKMLQKRYDQLLKSEEKAITSTVLQMEGDGSQFPRIFVKTDSEIKAEKEKERVFYEGLGYYLIALGLDSIKKMNLQDRSEKEEFGLTLIDKLGYPKKIFFGAKIIDSHNNISGENLERIKNEVDSKLKDDYKSNPKRIEIGKKITVILSDLIQSECKNNISDPIYKDFETAREIANKILEIED